ncbi:hypothetical protein [Streptomyces vinaceus]|uniref:hypothetical protein n=1 Tax=Streptomyces vinaceus TaxID=1960 RepID=UPI00369448C3
MAFGFAPWRFVLELFAFTGNRSGFRTARFSGPDPSAFAPRGCSRRMRGADGLSSGTTTAAGEAGPAAHDGYQQLHTVHESVIRLPARAVGPGGQGDVTAADARSRARRSSLRR